MSPKGVEHADPKSIERRRDRVIPSMSPKGVEHLYVVPTERPMGEGDSINVAERR